MALPAPSAVPVFDFDDLCALRALGAGLRHVSLEHGLREQAQGSSRGDAVSLANYGLGKSPHCSQDLVDPRVVCHDFQMKVEAFILDSYRFYHSSLAGYADAAFLLIARGFDARAPYDFLYYPLGKCGTAPITPESIFFLIRSDGWAGIEDVNDAAIRTLQALKEQIRALKIARMREFLKELDREVTPSQREVLRPMVMDLIVHYERNVRMDSDCFGALAQLFERVSWEGIGITDEAVSSFVQTVSRVDPERFKGEAPLSLCLPRTDFDAMDDDSRVERLIYFIQQNNVTRVRQCLALLPAPLPVLALSEACAYGTDILRTVYEHDPTAYDRLLASRQETPAYWATKYGRLGNLAYLLSVRQLTQKDMVGERGQHALGSAAYRADESTLALIALLQRYGVPLAFESDDVLPHENPLAEAVRQAGERGTQCERILEMLLRDAGARSKYAALVSATTELYFSYGRQERLSHDPQGEYPARTKALWRLRHMILDSLSKQECLAIRRLHADISCLGSAPGKQILSLDMLRFELTTLSSSNVDLLFKANIIRCFGTPDEVTRLNCSGKSNSTLAYEVTHITLGRRQACFPHGLLQARAGFFGRSGALGALHSSAGVGCPRSGSLSRMNRF